MYKSSFVRAVLGVGKECRRLGPIIHRGPNFSVIREYTIDIFWKKPCLREEEED